MIDPYRMVFVNTLLSVLVLGGILFYRFIYPKRRINLLILLIIISILPIISIFRNGAYESGDFNIHIYRTMEFYNSLAEGNIMPSWAKDLNATYGYPLFIFNYILPYYIISFFYFLGFSFIASMKIFLALTYILSGIFMYVFLKAISKNNLASFIGGIFYLFTPYHLIDLHFKVAVGELLTFTLIPLVFLFIYKLYAKRKFIYLILLALSFSLIIMGNALIAFFVGILAFPYVFFLGIRDKLNLKYLFASIAGFFMAALLSLYVLAAPFIFSKFLFIQNSPLKMGYSPSLLDLLYSPWRLGFLFQGHRGEIPYLIGYTQIFVILALLIAFIRGKIAKNLRAHVIFWLITIIITIFLITPYGRFLWENFSFAKAAGSHRLLLLLTFCISILAGYFALIFAKKRILITLLIITTIGYTILNWGHRRVIPEITDAVLIKNLWKSTSEGEGHFYANTRWVDIKNPWFSKLPKSHLEIVSGTGEIKDVLRTSTHHKYIINAKTPLKIQENTLYFPGWKGFVNGKEIQLLPSNKGVIQTSIFQGHSNLEIMYQDIFIYKLLKLISMLSLIGGVSIFIIRKFLHSYPH